MKFSALSIAFLLIIIAVIAFIPTTGPLRPKSIPKEWKLYHAKEAFSFWGPADLAEESVQAIDSYRGKWTSQIITIDFTYGGIFSGTFDREKYKTESLTIDGRSGTLGTSEEGVSLYVKRNSSTNFAINITCDKELRDQAIQMLKSLKFGKSTDHSDE